MMLEQYNDIITIPELCEVLTIGRNRAYELLKTGQISAFQLGRNWKIPKIALEEYLKKQAKIQ
ncbi:MAG: helix-turn-helix domain-containing protein [Hungatella sp.]|nr:helix-turn-helix domain-containing protein [Hungatella sp.]